MYKISGLILSVLIAITSCVHEPLHEFSKGNAKFSAAVIKAMANEDYDTCIISPLSVEIILALLTDGAKGETYDELQHALNFQNKVSTSTAIKNLLSILNEPHENFKLTTADKLYIDNKFSVKNEFEKTAVSIYQSEVEKVNFGENSKTAALINNWVAQKTDNKIQNLIKPAQLSSSTALVLVNALYLNAKWKTPFEGTITKKFHFLRKGVGNVQMMHSDDSASYLYHYCDVLKAKFLEIPYKGSTVSATFVLPDATYGIADLDKNAELYLKRYNMTLERVAVSLPTFSVTTEYDFKDILVELGASKIFGPEADLSGISDGRDLYVDFIQQKAFINITEAGTEAAAATAGGIVPYVLMQPPSLTFKADHPFFFYTRESKSKAILFAGYFL